MKLHRNDFTILLGLTIPLVLSGLMESAIPFISGVFLAQLGPLAFAAGSLTAWFFATLMVIIWGVFTSISTLIARYYGADNTHAVSWVLRDSLLLATFLVVPVTVLVWNFAPVLKLFGQSPEVVAMAVPYLHGLAWGLFPDFISLVLIQFVIGLGHTRVNLVFTLGWVPVSVLCIYILIFGKWGFPPLGIAGLGLGMSVSYWLVMFALGLYIVSGQRYRAYLNELNIFSAPKYLKELLTVGIPAGMMFFIEVSFFFTMSLIMGHYGLQQLAANQITMQYLGFFAPLVFSTAQAITIRMGHELGAGYPQIAHRAAYAGILLALGLVLMMAVLEWFAPMTLIRLDFNPMQMTQGGIIDLAIVFFAIAAWFQLGESVRIALFGALRALKDTQFPVLSSLIAFWGVAIPLGYVFAQWGAMGAMGYWVALALSTLPNMALLYWRYRRLITGCILQH